MQTKIKITEIKKEYYIADDGKEFVSQKDCQIYENFYPQTIYDVLKEYVTFVDNNTIADFKYNILQTGTYLIINKDIPNDIIRYCNILFNDEYLYCPNAYNIKEPTLYYFTHTYDGSSTTWECYGTYKALLIAKKDIENKLKKFNY